MDTYFLKLKLDNMFILSKPVNFNFSTNLKKSIESFEKEIDKTFIFIEAEGRKLTDDFIKDYISSSKEIDIDLTKVVFIIFNGYINDTIYQEERMYCFSTDSKIHSNTYNNSGISSRKVGKVDNITNFEIKSPSGSVISNLHITNGIPKIDLNIRMFEHYNTATCNMIFMYILHKSYEHLNSEYKTNLDKLLGKSKPFDYTSNISSFIKTFNSGITRKVTSLESEVEAQKKILLMKVKDLMEKRSLLNGSLSEKNVKEQVENLYKLKDLNWLELTSDYINVMTNNIIIECSLGTFDIGCILMKIHLESGRVYFKNMTRRRKGHASNQANHPHDASRGDGKMCLGEIESYIPELIADMQIESLVELLINFAKSVNLTDVAGKTIIAWPKI